MYSIFAQMLTYGKKLYGKKLKSCCTEKFFDSEILFNLVIFLCTFWWNFKIFNFRSKFLYKYICIGSIHNAIPAVIWPKYCRYGVKHYLINQSINQCNTINICMYLEKLLDKEIILNDIFFSKNIWL